MILRNGEAFVKALQ